ncbi:MAG TPA: hypothetical protein VGT98_09300 [Candidatus Elarobacter sp.]|nr:hypothetical protein [Candidatus Elarobacter sp.]
MTGNTMSYTLSPEMAVSRDRDIPATVQQAWAALPAVYEKLGLSVTAYDSASHTIVGERLRTRRDFGSRQLRSVVDCGDIAGVPAVDRYEINLKVRTVIERAGQASAIRSMVDATAKPSAVSGELMRCTVKEGVADEVASTLAAMVQS